MHGVEVDVDSTTIICRVGAGSFDTGSNYRYAQRRTYNNTGDDFTLSGQSAFDVDASLGTGNAAGENASGIVLFPNARSTAAYKTYESRCVMARANDTVGMATNEGVWLNSGSAIDRIRLAASNNFTAGTFTLYGLRK